MGIWLSAAASLYGTTNQIPQTLAAIQKFDNKKLCMKSILSRYPSINIYNLEVAMAQDRSNRSDLPWGRKKQLTLPWCSGSAVWPRGVGASAVWPRGAVLGHCLASRGLSSWGRRIAVAVLGLRRDAATRRGGQTGSMRRRGEPGRVLAWLRRHGSRATPPGSG
jgi:hypothetical protein